MTAQTPVRIRAGPPEYMGAGKGPHRVRGPGTYHRGCEQPPGKQAGALRWASMGILFLTFLPKLTAGKDRPPGFSHGPAVTRAPEQA